MSIFGRPRGLYAEDVAMSGSPTSRRIERRTRRYRICKDTLEGSRVSSSKNIGVM